MSTPNRHSAAAVRTNGFALALCVLMLGELLHLSLGIFSAPPARVDAVSQFTQVWFVLTCLFGLPACTIREKSLLVLATFLTFALLDHPDFWTIVSSAMGLAAFIGVFIAMLTVMKEAASRSRAVSEVGIHITRQPANKRFLSVAIGGHVMGAFLNFGAPSLLAPMVQEGARHSEQEAPETAEQRQVSALVRGFSWIILWAPTTLTQAVLLGLFTGIDHLTLLGLGLMTSVIMIALGLMLDRVQWGLPRNPGIAPRPQKPIKAFRNLSAICALLLVGTYGLKLAADLTVAQSLLFTAPLTTVFWLLSLWPDQNLPSRITRTMTILAAASPALLRSAIALGLSGYIGRISVYLLPIQTIATWLEGAQVAPFLFLAVLPLIITLGGQIALSPIIFVVFLGGIMAELPVYPADPTLTVFALSFGWALSMTAAPNATATLLLSAASGIAPTTLTWRWNGLYAVLCYLVFLTLIFLLTR